MDSVNVNGRTTALCGAEVLLQISECDALLSAGIAIAERYGVFLCRGFAKRVKIDSHTIGCADLILTAIALADVAVVIEEHIGKNILEHSIHFARLKDKLGFILEEREYRNAYRRHIGLKLKIDALLPTHLVFGVGFRKHGEQRTPYTK